MASDDSVSLPGPPPPRPAARRAAIDAALRRFDGIEDPPAPRSRPSLAHWASTHRAAAGGLVTAALIAIVSIPAIQVAVRDHPQEVASEEIQPAPARPAADANPEHAGNEAPALEAPAGETPAVPAGQVTAGRPAQTKESRTEPLERTERQGGFMAEARDEKAGVAARAPAAMAPPPPPPPPPAAPIAQSQAADVGNIVVTGSRIRRSNLESAAPVTVVDPYSDFLYRLQIALETNDRRAVMALVGLPLRVSFGGSTRTYRTRQDIGRDYDRIFTPAVRASVTNLAPDDLSNRDGGQLRGSGSIWFGCGVRECSSGETIRIREVHP